MGKTVNKYRFTEEQLTAIRMIRAADSFDEAVVVAERLFVPEHGKTKKLRIYFNRKLDVTPNKRAAHAVHAALTAFGVHPGVKVVVLDKGPTVMEDMRVVIHDAGHTELEPGTMTAATNWPEDSDE